MYITDGGGREIEIDHHVDALEIDTTPHQFCGDQNPNLYKEFVEI